MQSEESPESIRRGLRRLGFIGLDEEHDGDLNWLEVWVLSADSDFTVHFSSTRGDLDMSLESAKLKASTLPDVWLWATNGTPVVRDSRSAGIQLRILQENLAEIIQFAAEEDAGARLATAKEQAARLFIRRWGQP